MATETILAEASFNRSVRTYWLLSGTIVFVATIVGIVLLPLWWIFGHFFTERYLQHMSCTLTDRSLKVSKGLLVRQEKTVPLDKITDLALIEGPIMRFLDLQAVKVETAGQSSAGSLITLVGIVEARDFRDTVLRQRDAVVGAGTDSPPRLAASPAGGEEQVLLEIRDALLRIEQRLPESDSAE